MAADMALRTIGIPALELWCAVTENPDLAMEFQEDNSTMITVMRTGKNPTMRHLGRTHKVSVKWLHERFSESWVNLKHIISKLQAADIFTKPFTDSLEWYRGTMLINHVDFAATEYWGTGDLKKLYEQVEAEDNDKKALQYGGEGKASEQDETSTAIKKLDCELGDCTGGAWWTTV